MTWPSSLTCGLYSHTEPYIQKGPMIDLMVCCLDLEFLIILSLKSCFLSEVWWDNGELTGAKEILQVAAHTGGCVLAVACICTGSSLGAEEGRGMPQDSPGHHSPRQRAQTGHCNCRRSSDSGRSSRRKKELWMRPLRVPQGEATCLSVPRSYPAVSAQVLILWPEHWDRSCWLSGSKFWQ